MLIRSLAVSILMGTTALSSQMAMAQQKQNRILLPAMSPYATDSVEFASVTYIDLDQNEASGASESEIASPFTVRTRQDVEQELGIQPEDILMSYDSFTAMPILNVGLADASGVAYVGETLQFRTYWNYNHWVERAEIVLFDEELGNGSAPIATLAVGEGRVSQWRLPEDALSKSYSYQLKVYDSKGRYDVTHLKSISVLEREAEEVELPVTTPIYGEDSTLTRNIPINGGAVSVTAQISDPALVQNLHVLGRSIPIDESGTFAMQEIMPSGTHNVYLSCRLGRLNRRATGR